MGFARGPKIETDGLVLYLDAANKKSLEGEPTTNLIPNPTFGDGTKTPWAYQQTEYGNVSVVSDVYKSDGYSVRVERTSNTGEANCYLSVSSSYGTKPNTEYTFSVDVLCSTPNAARLLTYLGSINSHSPYHSGSGQWERLSLQCTTDSNGLIQVRFSIYNSSTLTHAYFDNVQLEEKSYATPFVNGTRDVWKDLTKNGNDGLIYNLPTLNGISKSLNFNGVNDHMGISNGVSDFKHSWSPNDNAGGSVFCYEIWIKTSDNVGSIISKPWNGAGQYNIKIHTGSFILLAGASSSTLMYDNTISNGEWTQLVCWANSTDMGYYVNGGEYFGSQTHNITGDIPSNGNANSKLSIMTLYPYGGSWGGSTTHAIEGELGLIRRYDKVLTQNQVLNNYNATKSRYGL
jgi:hypothetical protein